jgi:hypothetical protein
LRLSGAVGSKENHKARERPELCRQIDLAQHSCLLEVIAGRPTHLSWPEPISQSIYVDRGSGRDLKKPTEIGLQPLKHDRLVLLLSP